MNENVRAIRQQDDEAEAQQRRAEYIRAEFMKAAFMRATKLGDMSAPAPWAHSVTGWFAFRPATCIPTVGDAINSALDLGDGPTTSDVLGLFCNAAFGKHDEFAAYQLLNRLADSFIKHCV
ncbi:MAG: hypothetical protein JJD98_02635 [Polaromonas sp.]|nr:hypothetical protein [Polaromonas sp.]